VGASALTFGVFAVAAPAAFADTTPNATQITITPQTQTGTSNTDCLVYTATATANGAPAVGTIDVVLTEPAGTVASSESFCNNAQATQVGTAFNTGAGAPPAMGETFNTDANGQFTFGVFDTEAETVNIRAFDDENANHTPDAGEATTSTSTPPTAVFQAASTSTGNNNAHALTVTPSNINARPGDTGVYKVTATTGGNSPQPVNQVTVTYIITSGPDATNIPQNCQAATGAGNNNPQTQGNPQTVNGEAYCDVPTHAAGTDNITFYINQSNVANPTTGPDSGEPTATATLTDIGASPAGDTINVTCSTNGTNSADPTPGQNLKACHDFTTDNAGNPPPPPGAQDVFTATVTDPSANTNVIQGGIGNPNGQLANTPKGVTVAWTQSGGSATASMAPTSTACDPTATQTSTGGSGTCQSTLSEPNPTSGETVTVTGTIQGTTTTSSATKSFQVRPLAARNISLAPASQSGTSGTGRTVTATVIDVNGTPVPNVQVTFSTSGVGHFTSNGIFGTNQQYTTQTGPDGTVQAQVATNGSESGTETISATIPQGGSQCGDPAGFVNGTPNPTAKAGNCSATATVQWNKAAPPPTKRVAVKVSNSCFSHHKHKVTCVAQLSRAISGVTVVFFDGHGNKVGSDVTGGAGKAFLHLSGLKSHVRHKYQAHAKRSSKTFSATSGFAHVRVK